MKGFVRTVTVVMPCFNAERTVEEAVRSVLAQSFADWELLIVDDGSSDSSPAILQRLANEDGRIRSVRNPRSGGASAARNRALSEASGRYITFLDADDRWLPQKLDLQLNAMRAHGAALSCGAYDVMDGNGALIGCVSPQPGILSYRSLLRNNVIGCLTAMVDRSISGDLRFDHRLARGEDFHLWLSILKRGVAGVCLPEKLAVYRLHGNSLSSNKVSSARTRWRIYREFEQHGILASAWYFFAYAITGTLKMASMRRRQALQLLFGRS